jgi:hypothetical protein
MFIFEVFKKNCISIGSRGTILYTSICT